MAVDAEVIIVGGGLAGLACAGRLQAAGVDFALLEAADRPGGRIRTDRRDGFLFDRGFSGSSDRLSGIPPSTRLCRPEPAGL